MSIVSVFAALLLAMLLGMVMNVGRQVDGKIRLQNAADAAAYSGGLELARAMNALAFTNHLMCEAIAMTAILREASDPAQFPQHYGQLAASQVPRILAAWEKASDRLSQATFGKYQILGPELKVHLQQELLFVVVFTQWAAAFSAEVLPVLEYLLENELLPEYQRNLVVVFPRMAQAAAGDAARRNGDPEFGRGQMHAALWRWNGQLVGDPANEGGWATIPAVDPVRSTLPDQPQYLAEAREQRDQFARLYLRQWNGQIFRGLDLLVPFSKFKELWEKITCGRLEKLLEENAARNLPFQIRRLIPPLDPADPNIVPLAYKTQLEDNYTFVGAVYWRKMPGFAPRIFPSATESDSLAYAEVHVFPPRPRLVWKHPTLSGGGSGGESSWFGPLSPGTPGDSVSVWVVDRQSASYFPADWNLYSQNWACQLAPATQAGLDRILQTAPRMIYVDDLGDIKLPALGNLKSEDIQRISPH
ncbi:MAG: Tad domain-containing protein [Pirellulales bacterium]|nr:Tad domain-containing protein [Pirellulales bacterium]